MTTNFDQKIREYSEKFEQHKSSPKSLKWLNYRSAAQRYKEIVADINFDGKSILDVGCGFGDIIPFLMSQANDCSYTGIDMVDAFVQEASKRYPDFEFQTGNYFENPLERTFDYVICCGALNSNIPDPLDFRKRAIATMYEHCRSGIVFNMAGAHPQPTNKPESTIYYADSREVLDYCLELSRKVIFRQHYSRNDFTIVVLK